MAVGRPLPTPTAMSLGTSNVGVLLPSTSFRIYLEGTSTLATAYSDAAGSVVLASPASGWPLATDALGNLPAAMFLAHGRYELEINGARQPVEVSGGPSFYVGPPAAGTASGKDKAAVSAAHDAAVAAPTGGTVLLGSGQYDVGDYRPIFPEWFATRKQVVWKGQGYKDATSVYFSTQVLTDGVYALGEAGAASGNSGGIYETMLEDIAFIGPGTSPAVGTSPGKLCGVILSSHMIINRCTFTKFHVGIKVAGHHSVVRDTHSNGNYYGVYWDNGTSGGNIIFSNLDRAGNRFASEACAPTASINCYSTEGHLGFSPYCFYWEPGRTPFVSPAAMYVSIYYGTSFEYIGNGFMHSPDQTAYIYESYFNGCSNFTIRATYRLPSTTYTEHVKVHQIQGLRFENSPFQDMPTSCVFDVSYSVNNVVFNVGGSKVVTYSITAGIPIVRGAAMAARLRTAFYDEGYKVLALPTHTSTAVAAKQLVEWYNLGQVRPHGTGGAAACLPLAGIALTGAAGGSRDYVLVAQDHSSVEVNLAGGVAPNVNQVLVTSTTTRSSVEPLNWDGSNSGRPVVGYLSLAVVGNASVFVKISGGRFQ